MLERAPMDLALFARFLPSWDHIDPLRQYAELLVKGRASAATADKTSIAVQELLENAIKYGIPTSDVEFEILIARDASSFDVRVRNSAVSSRLMVLQREFPRVAGDSARDSFSRALQRLQRLPPGTSMLGLSRVALEANLQLEVTGDRVAITARIEAVVSPNAAR